MGEQCVSPLEIKDWLIAFKDDPSQAFAMIPNHVYSFLRKNGLIDIEHDWTDSARSLMEAS